MTMITVMLTGCGKKNVDTEINVPESSTSVIDIAQGSEIEESTEVIESEEIFETSEAEETSEIEETSSTSDNEEETIETEETIESTESTPAPQETAKPVTSTKPQETTKPEVKPSEAPVVQETAKPTAKPQESTKPQETVKPQETAKPTPEVHTHKYTDKVTTKATCKSEGVKTFTCNCGDTYTETIAKSTTHTFNNGATCTVCGTSNPNYVAPTPTPANPDTPWDCEVDGHKFVAVDEFIEDCSVCGASRATGCGNGAHLGYHFCDDRTYSDATHYTVIHHNWCSSCGWEECYSSVNTYDPETGVSWESSRTYGSYAHACNK